MSKDFTQALRKTSDDLTEVLGDMDVFPGASEESIVWEAADKIDELEYKLKALKVLFESCELSATDHGALISIEYIDWVMLRNEILG